MEFLPLPQKITHLEGTYPLRYYTDIVLVDTEPSAFLYAQMLQKDFETYAGLRLLITRGRAFAHDIALKIDPELPYDHYLLSITPETASVTAGSDEALLHGVQTFGQYVQRHGGVLPCILVEDWPSLPNRGYYQDISRGRVPTLESLKEKADLLCRYKINQWQLYVEHTYLFRSESEAWREDTPLTAEEIMELDAYCRARHIELVPSLASFGHMYRILSTKSRCALCELEDSEKQPFRYSDTGIHHTLNVSHPCAMRFIKKLISEYMALFSSRKFNICCDETIDLCKCRSAKYAGEHGGVQEVYVSFVAELCQWLIDQGKTPQFWGDIIEKSPELYHRIPKETICLSWGYEIDQSDKGIKTLHDIGATQYVCPGIWGWAEWIPLFEDSYHNIRLMSRYAQEYGAVGLLNTDWGDGGHTCSPLFSVPGILYGAAFGWNPADVPFEEINAAISFLHYGQKEGTFVSAFAKLSGLSLMHWRRMLSYIESNDHDSRERAMQTCMDRLPQTQEIYDRIHRSVDELMAMAPQLDKDKREIIQAVCIAAGAVHMFNDVALYLAVHFHGLDGVEYRNGDTLACDLEYWFMYYKAEWRKTSRTSELNRLQSVISRYADMLRGK